jgi:hypothetical protein
MFLGEINVQGRIGGNVGTVALERVVILNVALEESAMVVANVAYIALATRTQELAMMP